MAKYTIQLVDKLSDIKKKVTIAFRDELNAQLPKAASRIEVAIKNRTDQFFMNTPEAQALINGPLNFHFGIPAGEELVRVGSIIRTIANNVSVTSKRVSLVGNSLRGGLTVGVLISDFSDVLSNPEAIIVTDKGQSLPWLEWLLLEGDRIIITDYEIAFGHHNHSRSGNAIMKKNTGGGIWRVPPQYSGTIRNNWLTRAILGASNAYVDMVNKVVENELN